MGETDTRDCTPSVPLAVVLTHDLRDALVMIAGWTGGGSTEWMSG